MSKCQHNRDGEHREGREEGDEHERAAPGGFEVVMSHRILDFGLMICVSLGTEFEPLAFGAAPGVDEAQIACAEAELAQHAGPAQLR